MKNMQRIKWKMGGKFFGKKGGNRGGKMDKWVAGRVIKAFGYQRFKRKRANQRDSKVMHKFWTPSRLAIFHQQKKKGKTYTYIYLYRKSKNKIWQILYILKVNTGNKLVSP